MHKLSAVVQTAGQGVEWPGAGSGWMQSQKQEGLPPEPAPRGQVGAVATSHLFLPLTPEPVNTKPPSQGAGKRGLALCSVSPSSPEVSSQASSSLERQKHPHHIPCGNSLFSQGRKSFSFALDAGQMCDVFI